MHALRFYLTWEQKSDFNIVFFSGGRGGGGVGNIQLAGKLLPFQSFFHRFWPWKKACSQVLRFSTPWKTLWKFRGFSHRVFHRYFHRLKTHRVFHRVSHRFWPCEKCPVHRVSMVSHPVKKVWKPCEKTCEIEQFTCFFHSFIHRFFIAFSHVFIQ